MLSESVSSDWIWSVFCSSDSVLSESVSSVDGWSVFSLSDSVLSLSALSVVIEGSKYSEK